MPDYLFVYHGGSIPETEEESKKAMAAWGAWFGSIEAAIKDPGNPIGASSTVTAQGITPGGGANPASGYTIVTANDRPAAEALAKECPILGEGGSVEVAEIVPIEM